jgi:type I restriction enzyme, S subunit
MSSRRRSTKTGGRGATTRFIPGEVALAVGSPPAPKTPEAWRWVKLTDVARMESGHTPSRKHPEYWGGDVPWIGIRDAKEHHGEVIESTFEATNQLGIENSSARVLPTGTVCLSRTASVGYVVVMGQPMATSQDFANWICSEEVEPHYLKYLLLAERKSFARFASGATHQTIYYPELKAFHVCLPPLRAQQRIVAILDAAFAGIGAAVANAETNLANAREVFENYLKAIFLNGGEEWESRSIGEVCVLKSGATVNKMLESPSGDVPYIKVADLNLPGNEKRVTTSSRFLSDPSRTAVFPVGTTVFPKRGGAILTNKKRITDVPLCADLNIMGVIPGDLPPGNHTTYYVPPP